MNRWVLGWALGTVVVAIAAGLLVAIILLCRRIVRQASDITRALDGARKNTDALFGLTTTNGTLERVTGELRAVREGTEAP